MRKIIIFSSLFIISTFFVIKVVEAAGIEKGFGGKVISAKATEIQSLENSNFGCIVPGQTIQIRPIGKGNPSSYFIPASIPSKTKNKLHSSQWILGKYTPTKTTITCIYKGYPPSEATVTLDTINLYGTSK